MYESNFDRDPMPARAGDDLDGWDSPNWQEVPIFSCDPSTGGTALWPSDVKEVIAENLHRLKVLRSNSSQTLSVYIPASSENTVSYRDELLTLLANFCGGATSVPMMGVYKAKSGALIFEKNFLVYAWIDGDLMAEALRMTLSFTERLKEELNQDAVLIEINRRPIIDRRTANDRP
jgi:hypothetical protein